MCHLSDKWPDGCMAVTNSHPNGLLRNVVSWAKLVSTAKIGIEGDSSSYTRRKPASRLGKMPCSTTDVRQGQSFTHMF